MNQKVSLLGLYILIAAGIGIILAVIAGKPGPALILFAVLVFGAFIYISEILIASDVERWMVFHEKKEAEE